jgi:hypothetical protein
MCFDFLYEFLSKTFIILRKIWRYVVISIRTFLCKYPGFSETSNFSTDLGKMIEIKFHVNQFNFEGLCMFYILRLRVSYKYQNQDTAE